MALTFNALPELIIRRIFSILHNDCSLIRTHSKNSRMLGFIPVAYVCSLWRHLALPMLHKVAFIEVYSDPADSIPHDENATRIKKTYKANSNINRIVNGNYTHLTKELRISAHCCCIDLSVIMDVFRSTGFDSKVWSEVIAFQYSDYDQCVLSTGDIPRYSTNNPSELSNALIHCLPNVKAVCCDSMYMPSDPLSHPLTAFIEHSHNNLSVLMTGMSQFPMRFDSLAHSTTHLSLNHGFIPMPFIPTIHTQLLRYLSLRIRSMDELVSSFAKTCTGTEFPRLRTLELVFSGDNTDETHHLRETSYAINALRAARFPSLHSLIIINYPHDISVLLSAFPVHSLKTLKLVGQTSGIEKLNPESLASLRSFSFDAFIGPGSMRSEQKEFIGKLFNTPLPITSLELRYPFNSEYACPAVCKLKDIRSLDIGTPVAITELARLVSLMPNLKYLRAMYSDKYRMCRNIVRSQCIRDTMPVSSSVETLAVHMCVHDVVKEDTDTVAWLVRRIPSLYKVQTEERTHGLLRESIIDICTNGSGGSGVPIIEGSEEMPQAFQLRHPRFHS